MLSGKQAGTTGMPDIRARVMECSEAEEHILGLIGKAVVAQWDHLPSSVRDQLLKQAGLVHGWDENPELHKQIISVILKFQGYPS
jgi:hypothetical protein